VIEFEDRFSSAKPHPVLNSTTKALYHKTYSVDATTLTFLVLSVVSTARLVSGLVYVCSGALSPGRSYERCDKLLCVEVLSALAGHVVVHLLPGVYVPDGGSACYGRLWPAHLEARDVCDVLH
jgi:hypothetical protein